MINQRLRTSMRRVQRMQLMKKAYNRYELYLLNRRLNKEVVK